MSEQDPWTALCCSRGTAPSWALGRSTGHSTEHRGTAQGSTGHRAHHRAQGTARPRASTAYQAQTAVAHSNHQALDVFHWLISIWQDLKFQGHKTQSYYFISGKRTATSLESCPFAIKGQVQRREWRGGICSHHIPQLGRDEPITPQIAHFVSDC